MRERCENEEICLVQKEISENEEADCNSWRESCEIEEMDDRLSLGEKDVKMRKFFLCRRKQVRMRNQTVTCGEKVVRMRKL